MLELTKDVLRGWMDAGYASAAQAHGVEDASWWPKEARCGQSECTAWAWAAFLAAASDLRGGSWGSVKFAANRGKNWDVRQAVLLDAGFPEEQQSRHEILVDFSLHDWNANPPVLATAESEMCSTWGVGPSMNGDDDYTWDFYKLLQVVSPFRLFFCRVGPRDNDTGSARRDRLLAVGAVAVVRNVVSIGSRRRWAAQQRPRQHHRRAVPGVESERWRSRGDAFGQIIVRKSSLFFRGAAVHTSSRHTVQ